MFQIATVIAHALRTRTNYILPSRSGKRNQFPMMFPHLPIQNGEVETRELYREQEFGVYHPLPVSDNLHLQGYFQSEKYFKDYKKEVLEAFGFFNPGGVRSHTVAIHVRRGDYVRLHHKHNVITRYWIEMAMERFPEPYQFYFFSDDLDWCVQNFNNNFRCHFVRFNDPKTEMLAISSYEHCIMSPSSFSWWANWIASNNGNGRIVIIPKDWFNPNYTKLRADDIVPENWIRI